MAIYGLKYYCDYRSKMRDRLLYRIEIEERNNPNTDEANAAMLRPYADVFTLAQGGADDPEYTAIKGCSLTLKILCVEDMEYLSLFTTDPRKYRITIYKYQDDEPVAPAKELLWRGFLAANSYKEEYARPPYVVTLSATDGLSLLGAMPFRDTKGAKYTGTISVYELLQGAIESIELDLPVCEWLNLESDDSTIPSLKSVYIDRARIYGMYENPTWLNVLEICVQSFGGQIFQANGVFHIRRIVSLRSMVRPAAFSKVKNRPVLHDMWREGCDANASNDLNLLAPYKYAEVKLISSEDGDVDIYYNSQDWKALNSIRQLRVLKNRVYVEGVGSRIEYKSLSYQPVEKIAVSVSFDVFNATNSEIYASCYIKFQQGENIRYWNVKNSAWDNDISDDTMVKKTIGASGVTQVSNYYPLSGLQSQSFDFSVTSIPKLGDKAGNLIVGFYIYGFSGYREKSFIANIDISNDLGSNSPDISGVALAVTPSNSDKCSWDVPIRDGGYNANAEAILPNVLVDMSGVPIVSWVSQTERGFIMDILADDIRRLRANVIRQLGGGDLRCPYAVDLNSLFRDWRFTKAIYYVNSWELNASRQVYKVQMRELLDMNRILNPLELTHIQTFTDNEHIFASLHCTLFLRTGIDSYGSKLFDTETRTEIELPYRSDKLDIRKGFNAVVLQIGDTDLYALDNVGNVLSHLDSNTTDVVNYDTALYDAARGTWVSYDATTTAGKVTITIFTDSLELESQDIFDVVATGMTLMSNGYLIHTTSNTYWHNYELHPADTLLAIDNEFNPMSAIPAETLAVSDSLVVMRDSATSRAVTSVKRRIGREFKVSEAIYVLDEGFGQVEAVNINNAIAAAKTNVDSESYLSAYDLRGKMHCRIKIERNSGIAVCGANVCVMSYNADGNHLSYISFDNNVGTGEQPKGSIQFRLKVIDAVSGAGIPGVNIVADFKGSEHGRFYTDGSGRLVWNFEQTEQVWNASYVGSQMRFWMQFSAPLSLLDSQGRTLYDSTGRALQVQTGQDVYFEGEMFVDLVSFGTSVADGYDAELKLIRLSDFVLTPANVELPGVGGGQDIRVTPGLFDIRQYTSAAWLKTAIDGKESIRLSAGITDVERSASVEFGPDAYGCLGRRSVQVKQLGAEALSRSLHLQLSIHNASGGAITADEIRVFWTGSGGLMGNRKYENLATVDDVVDDVSVGAFRLLIVVNASGFKTKSMGVDIPAGAGEYTVTETVTLENTSRRLFLDFRVVDTNDAPVENAEIAVTYTNSAGKETLYTTTGSSAVVQFPSVTSDAFSLGVAVAKDGYNVYENIVPVPAGEDDYTYNTDAVLTPLSPQKRTLNLDLSIVNVNNAPVDAQSVEIRYVKSDGTQSVLTTSGTKITDVISDATIGYFDMTVAVNTPGYEPHTEEISIVSGTEAMAVRKTLTLDKSARVLNVDFTIKTAGNVPVAGAEVAVVYTQPAGKETYYGTSSAADGRVQATITGVTSDAFSLGVVVDKDGYETYENIVSVPAGEEAYTYDINVVLSPFSSQKRTLYIDLSFVDADNAPVNMETVYVRYVNSDGIERTRTMSGVEITDTISDATAGYFDLKLETDTPGYEDYSENISIVSGTEAVTVRKTITLQPVTSKYNPSVSFTPVLPWHAAPGLVSMTNDGDITLELLALPAWCNISKELPTTISVGSVITFAFSRNETGAARSGTISMQYHDPDYDVDIAYSVVVTQQG